MFGKGVKDKGMEIRQSAVAGTLESSDVMVTVEPGENGIDIVLQSVVEKQFGREIRRAITETLDELGVRQVRLKAVDKGALDCTIRARVKTALHRASGREAAEWKA